jgi:hypothetical protein
VLRPKNNGNGKNIVETVYEPKIPNTVSQKWAKSIDGES